MKPQYLQELRKCAALVFVAVMLATAFADGRFALADSKAGIDRELLEKLGGEPVDDLDRELFAPKKKTSDAVPGKELSRKTDGSERPGDEMIRDLLRELRRSNENDDKTVAPDASTAPAESKDNPLVSIARQMRDVERRIVNTDSGRATQKTQQQIVSQLDMLIEQAKKSCCGGGKPGQKQCKGGTGERKKVAQGKKPSKSNSTGKGSKPGQSTANAAVEKQDSPNRTDMEQMQALQKRLWGELPEREREQMLQYMVEQFLPEYEKMIEEYYKRLSEGKGNE
ncbi:MAG: hypothetical protein JXM70_01745 [Pirellulales bacterium]|nr:hypothetical protein [Pirellulales bacterium]